MFIALEGVDCSGKTITAHLLSTQAGFVSYKTPPKDWRAKRTEVDVNASPRDHYLFYLEGVCKASIDIQILFQTGARIVCDRYWLTTYVYHKVMGVEVDLIDFEGITLPNITVLLRSSPEVQAERFLQRGLSAGDRRMINVQASLERQYLETIKNLDINAKIINTDNLTPQEVIQRIVSHLAVV